MQEKPEKSPNMLNMRPERITMMPNRLSKDDSELPSSKRCCGCSTWSMDDLPNMLHDLGKNKKKANNSWILQAAINQCATAPTCIANEFMKPQLSTHINDKFCSYAWVATGNRILMDSITLFNIAFMIKPAAQAMAKIFLKNDSHFPANTTTCTYQLAAHSLLMDIMLGEHNAFTVTYITVSRPCSHICS